jgi:putrescine transport system permease protein
MGDLNIRIRTWARGRVPSGRTVAIAIPFAFLLVFFMLPFLMVLKISFAESTLDVPPYSHLIELGKDRLGLMLNFESYLTILTDDIYFSAYLSSIRVAFFTTLICLLVGYPAAFLIARARPALRNLLMMGVILPFWTSYLVRIYAWIGILKDQGLINSFLVSHGITDEPLHLMQNTFGLYVGMVYSYLPYMILPLYAFLVKMNHSLPEAASDLGARPWEVFLTITLPLSIPGMTAGSLLVFIPSVGEYVIPELLGGTNDLMIGRVMWSDFFNSIAWPLASAATCVMVALLLLPMVWFQRIQSKDPVAA